MNKINYWKLKWVTRWIVLWALCSGCATTQTVRLDEGLVPEKLQTLEQEVLEDTRKFGTFLENSGAFYEDPQLEAYLQEIVQPLVPELPTSIPYRFRFKIVRDPTLNAYTLGDGAIYFHTGLIARLTSAQQMAFIAGHEIAHVMNRDLVYFTDSLHRKTITAKVTDLVLTPALAVVGLGGVGEAGVGLAYRASITGYGRQREAQADEASLKTLQHLGYNGRAALGVFETLLAEDKRYQKGIEISFLSSHPANEERMKAVKTFLGIKGEDIEPSENKDTLDGSGPSVSQHDGYAIDAAFLDATHRLRIDNAAMDIQLQRYDHAIQQLRAILERRPQEALTHHYLAEAYRLIGDNPHALRKELNYSTWEESRREEESLKQPAYWRQRAREAYQEAMRWDATLADPYRGLGLLVQAEGRDVEALESFQRYLELSPSAKDRRFVLSWIDRLKANTLKANTSTSAR